MIVQINKICDYNFIIIITTNDKIVKLYIRDITNSISLNNDKIIAPKNICIELLQLAHINYHFITNITFITSSYLLYVNHNKITVIYYFSNKIINFDVTENISIYARDNNDYTAVFQFKKYNWLTLLQQYEELGIVYWNSQQECLIHLTYLKFSKIFEKYLTVEDYYVENLFYIIDTSTNEIIDIHFNDEYNPIEIIKRLGYEIVGFYNDRYCIFACPNYILVIIDLENKLIKAIIPYFMNNNWSIEYNYLDKLFKPKFNCSLDNNIIIIDVKNTLYRFDIKKYI